MNNKAFALIGVTIVIISLGIIALAIVTYISEGLRADLTNINQTKSLYMAQAGIERAIVDYKDDGLWDSIPNVNVSGEFYYHLGEDANFLYVDATSPSISKKIIKNIPIKNINATDTITITDLVLSWSFGGNINAVTLGGTSVWTGSASSPANINIADLAIASDASYSNTDDQIWEFSRNVAGDLAVSFVFSDGSSYTSYLLKDGLGWDKAFSIKATGEIRSGAAVEARRTLLATYDIGTDNITSWEESQEHIIP